MTQLMPPKWEVRPDGSLVVDNKPKRLTLRVKISKLLAESEALEETYTEVLQMQQDHWKEYVEATKTAASGGITSETQYAEKRLEIYAKLADKIIALITSEEAL